MPGQTMYPSDLAEKNITQNNFMLTLSRIYDKTIFLTPNEKIKTDHENYICL